MARWLEDGERVERDKKIARQRNENRLTYSQIAQRWGLKVERVRQIVKNSKSY